MTHTGPYDIELSIFWKSSKDNITSLFSLNLPWLAEETTDQSADLGTDCVACADEWAERSKESADCRHDLTPGVTTLGTETAAFIRYAGTI
ncbi:hypothetical protein PoB_002979800 [Plakobranchus ocellatus]|uniref:Uncharacterized protein n=1 Tax=Plakobranchus ocellatus TaxID=259542 RepID=A0AAV4A7T3_9GAST|nr:hypothetical protein PoB_002979800 [Plakobranchus ocellatus]